MDASLMLPFTMKFLSNLCSCLQRHGGDVAGDEDNGEESWGLFFELQTLQIATNFFSDLNLLGHGGFGPVYKGMMPNGQEIAVKKLSLDSRQGTKEFTNEVKLLLKVQHRNLVTLFGCCVEGPTKLLVYEYLPNKSLDCFLFARKARTLDWTKRFQIVTGIARGLLYLHEEAPLKIIHRDIKASNILLDGQLNPKISDFGLARLFPDDDTHVNTFKISGTYGYIAPEYALHGYLSVKADVFSFGVLLLEIVSGRKNHDGKLGGQKADLLNYAWAVYQEGKTMELVDSNLENYSADEAAIFIQLGLLCCQSSISDRPDMNAINLILSSDSFTLPKPGKPATHGRMGKWATTSSSAFTDNTTNSNSTLTCATNATCTMKASGDSSVVDESRK